MTSLFTNYAHKSLSRRERLDTFKRVQASRARIDRASRTNSRHGHERLTVDATPTFFFASCEPQRWRAIGSKSRALEARGVTEQPASEGTEGLLRDRRKTASISKRSIAYLSLPQEARGTGSLGGRKLRRGANGISSNICTVSLGVINFKTLGYT